MFSKLGTSGVVGVIAVLAGLGLVAYQAPIVAAGMALVLVGMALVAKGIVGSLLSSFGMGGMV